jgi:transposase InsO family protein
MLNFVDRHTAEYFLYFLAGNSSSEIGSALNEHCQKLHHRLPVGGIGQWHTDNETGFNGPEVSAVAEDLVRIHTHSVPYDSNTYPVAERNFGILGSAMRRILAHADAPSCLWP